MEKKEAIQNIGRILGIDYGEKRIGLAISDEEAKFAFEFEIWPKHEFFKKIKPLLLEKEIKKIVLGYPINMAGRQTKKTEEVLAFKKQLESETAIAVELADERLTSKMAANISGSAKNIDALSAQIFLQNYINKHSNQ